MKNSKGGQAISILANIFMNYIPTIVLGSGKDHERHHIHRDVKVVLGFLLVASIHSGREGLSLHPCISRETDICLFRLKRSQMMETRLV